MKNMIELDALEKTLDRVHEWVRAADNKISILFALEGLVLTILASGLFNFPSIEIRCLDYLGVILLLSSVVLLFVSLYKSLMSIMSRLKTGTKNESLIYFGSISKMSLREYKIAIKNMSQNEYKNQMVDQIYISSVIANSKHANFRDSILAFSISLLLIFIFGLLQILQL